MRKIRRLVFLLRLHRRIADDLRIRRRRAAILTIGHFPQGTRDGIAVVRQRKWTGGNSRRAILVVRIVEYRAAHTHRYVGPAAVRRVGWDGRSVRPRDLKSVLIVHLITDEVRSRVGLGKGVLCSF